MPITITEGFEIVKEEGQPAFIQQSRAIGASFAKPAARSNRAAYHRVPNVYEEIKGHLETLTRRHDFISYDWGKFFSEPDKDANMKLAQQLCEKHTLISTYQGIFGGIPHIKGMRLAVKDVLAQLYHLGNIEGVVSYYAPHLTEAQVKEAIAFAHDFMEMACVPESS